MSNQDQINALSRELRALEGSKRFEHKRDVATRILAIDPRDASALYALASAHYGLAIKTNDDASFKAMCDTTVRALQYYPETAEFYHQLYQYYLWYGGEYYIQARDCLLQAIRLRPLSGHFFRSLGEIYMINREADKAAKYLREAVRLSPEEAEYRSRLALALLRQGKVEESLEVGKRALQDAPDDQGVLDTVGMLYILTGDLDKAEIFFRDAIKHDPTYNYFHQHQDWIKRELKDRDVRLRQGRKYTPLYIRQKQTKRFFDEDGDETIALWKGPSPT